MKKIATCVILTALLASSLISTSANAATIKGGVACAKANSITKVGTKSYKCARNPYVTPTKLTWTLSGCLTAYALWKDSKQQYADWADIAKAAGAEGQKTLDDLQASIDSLEKTMKTQICIKGA